LKVSVIIPTLNEAGILGETLGRVRRHEPYEVIVADGGSVDGTLEIAGNHPSRIIQSPPGRAVQMNSGARAARGDLLVFLHADSTLDPEGYQKMVDSMKNPLLVGGAFSLHIDSPRFPFRVISTLANFRARYLNLVYGDQAIFVRTRVFHEAGGFSPLPICEDMEFFRRLGKQGDLILLREKAATSARRWLAEGIAFTTLRNTIIAGLFLMGFSPNILSKWYLPVR